MDQHMHVLALDEFGQPVTYAGRLEDSNVRYVRLKNPVKMDPDGESHESIPCAELWIPQSRIVRIVVEPREADEPAR